MNPYATYAAIAARTMSTSEAPGTTQSAKKPKSATKIGSIFTLGFYRVLNPRPTLLTPSI